MPTDTAPSPAPAPRGITRTPGKEVDPTPSPSSQQGKPSYRKAEPVMATREDIHALPMKAEAKTVLLWLLDQPARVYERNDIAKALGMRAAFVERGLVWLRRRCTWLRLPRSHPETGTALHGRHGYIPADSHLRAAWASKKAPKAAPKASPPPTFKEGAAVDVPIGEQGHTNTVRVTDVQKDKKGGTNG